MTTHYKLWLSLEGMDKPFKSIHRPYLPAVGDQLKIKYLGKVFIVTVTSRMFDCVAGRPQQHVVLINCTQHESNNPS